MKIFAPAEFRGSLGGAPHALIDLLDRLDVNPDRERHLGFTVVSNQNGRCA
jgi:hypothetical protein